MAAATHYRDIAHLTALARRAINTVGADGVMTGTAPGKFDPSGPVTRAQAVKFAVNLADLNLEFPRTATFEDISKHSHYYPYVETAYTDGLLRGMSDATSHGKFDPSTPITRADLAVLLTNALGQQSLAQSLASDTTLFPKLTDLGTVPSGDLGAVNAMMKLGVVPPLTATAFRPAGHVNREQMAVALYRGLLHMKAASPASLTVKAAQADVAVGTADPLTVGAAAADGVALTSAQLAQYSIRYSVTGVNAASATVTGAGVFSATASGAYTVRVALSGGNLTSPLTATTTIDVYGQATALKIIAATTSLVADGSSTPGVGSADKITVEAVDPNGNVVPNWSGTITLYDTGAMSEILMNNGTSLANTATASVTNGMATFTVESTSGAVGASDTLTATASASSGPTLTEGTLTLTSVAATAAAVVLHATPTAIDTNGANDSTELTVEITDAAGQEYTGASEQVTLSLSGPGSFAPISGATTAATTNETEYVDGSTTVPVYAQEGARGTIEVTATSSGLRTGTLGIAAVVNGSPSQLALKATTGTTASGVSYTDYTVQIEDASGNPVTSGTGSADTIQITDNTESVGGELAYFVGPSLTNGVPTGPASHDSPGAFTAQLVDGAYEFAVETVKTAPTPATITVVDQTENLHASAPFTFQVGAPAQVAFVENGYSMGTAVSATALGAIPMYLTSGATYTLSVQLEDASGNPVQEANQTVNFSLPGSGTAAASINGNSTEGVPFPEPTNAQGVASVQVKAASVVSASAVEIEASAESQSTPATLSATVEPLAAASSQLSLSDNSAPMPASIVDGPAGAFSLVIHVQNGVAQDVNEGDTLLVTSSAPQTLVLNGGTYSLGTTNSVEVTASTVNGSVSVNVQGALAGQSTLTVTDLSNPDVRPTSATLTVTSTGVATGATFYFAGKPVSPSNPLTVIAQTPVLLQVESTDAGGNPINVTAPTTYTLSDANGGGFLVDNNGSPGAVTSTVTIGANTFSASVFYVNKTGMTITGGLSATP